MTHASLTIAVDAVADDSADGGATDGAQRAALGQDTSQSAAHDGAGDATLVGTVFQNNDYGIAFHNGSDLRKQADEALLKMREDGDYDMIKEKWFGTES